MASPADGRTRARGTAALGVLISLLLLWWVLHDVSLGEVWHEIRNAKPGWFAAAIVAATLTFPLRAIRWRYLLRNEGAVIPLGPLWHATAIGFMANNLLPARAGEFARAYAARQLTGVRFMTAFASIAIERILDGLFLVGLLMVGFLGGGFTTAATIGGVRLSRIAVGGAAFFGAVFVVALAVVSLPHLTRKVSHSVLHRIFPERWAARLLGLIDGLLDGLTALREPGRLAWALFWSLVLWLTNASSFALAFVAFGISLPWGAALVLQGILAFGVAIPSSPGFFGVFEGATRASLVLYGVAASSAVSLAIGYHIAGFIPITVLGLWSLGQAGMHMKDLRTGQVERGEEEGREGSEGREGRKGSEGSEARGP